jgi:hypothetical protein
MDTGKLKLMMIKTMQVKVTAISTLLTMATATATRSSLIEFYLTPRQQAKEPRTSR